MRLSQVSGQGREWTATGLEDVEADIWSYFFPIPCHSTSGCTSSVLHQVASDHSDEFTMAAKIIRSQFYMDDCFTGADTLEVAIDI